MFPCYNLLRNWCFLFYFLLKAKNFLSLIFPGLCIPISILTKAGCSFPYPLECSGSPPLFSLGLKVLFLISQEIGVSIYFLKAGGSPFVISRSGVLHPPFSKQVKVFPFVFLRTEDLTIHSPEGWQSLFSSHWGLSVLFYNSLRAGISLL